jgi:hypothetical protein
MSIKYHVSRAMDEFMDDKTTCEKILEHPKCGGQSLSCDPVVGCTPSSCIPGGTDPNCHPCTASGCKDCVEQTRNKKCQAVYIPPSGADTNTYCKCLNKFCKGGNCDYDEIGNEIETCCRDSGQECSKYVRMDMDVMDAGGSSRYCGGDGGDGGDGGRSL